MLNFQWGLFCILGFGVTFFKFLHIKLDINFLSHDLIVLFQGCCGAHFWHFYKFFTCHCDLIICNSKIYHVFNSLYVDYHNLNVRCIVTNIFYNGFCRHGGEIALVWTWPSSWIASIGKCSSNTTRWAFWSWRFVVGSCHLTHSDTIKPLPCWSYIHPHNLNAWFHRWWRRLMHPQTFLKTQMRVWRWK